MRIFNTKDIDSIISKYNSGHKMTRKNNLLFRNIDGTLDDNISVVLTHDELAEYSKCANDVCYFVEIFCGILLSDFQKEWIDNFKNNRFMIYCTSRQTGYSLVMSAVYLHYMIFNKNKNILVVSNIGENASEFVYKIFKFYQRIPYYLKPGIITKNSKKIEFNNGNTIIAQARSKIAPSDYNIDMLSYMEFSHIPRSILDIHYSTLVPKICERPDTRICIQSQPNGFNKFYELINDSERKPNDPKKNIYKSIKTYWWEVTGRDESWKREHTYNIGGSHAFDQEYDLQFVSTT